MTTERIYTAVWFDLQTDYEEHTAMGVLDRTVFAPPLQQIIGTAWLEPDDPALASLAPIRMRGATLYETLEWNARIVNVEMRQVVAPGSAPVPMAYVTFVSDGPHTRL